MQRVELEHDGAVATIRLNRPEVLNAIDQGMWQELLEAFGQLDKEKSLRACLITGNGRGFCSGADLKETAWHGETAAQSKTRIDTHHQHLARSIIGLPVPVIACINGYALGGGLEIALACDIRIASQTAKFGFPEAAIGRFITGGASLLLPRAIGLSQAKRLLYTSEHIEAARALAIGLVDEVVQPDALLDCGMALARQIAQNAAPSIALMKQTLDDIAMDDLEHVLARETEALVSTYSHSEIDDAATAFNRKDKSRPQE